MMALNQEALSETGSSDPVSLTIKLVSTKNITKPFHQSRPTRWEMSLNLRSNASSQKGRMGIVRTRGPSILCTWIVLIALACFQLLLLGGSYYYPWTEIVLRVHPEDEREQNNYDGNSNKDGEDNEDMFSLVWDFFKVKVQAETDLWGHLEMFKHSSNFIYGFLVITAVVLPTAFFLGNASMIVCKSRGFFENRAVVAFLSSRSTNSCYARVGTFTLKIAAKLTLAMAMTGVILFTGFEVDLFLGDDAIDKQDGDTDGHLVASIEPLARTGVVVYVITVNTIILFLVLLKHVWYRLYYNRNKNGDSCSGDGGIYKTESISNNFPAADVTSNMITTTVTTTVGSTTMVTETATENFGNTRVVTSDDDNDLRSPLMDSDTSGEDVANNRNNNSTSSSSLLLSPDWPSSPAVSRYFRKKRKLVRYEAAYEEMTKRQCRRGLCSHILLYLAGAAALLLWIPLLLVPSNAWTLVTWTYTGLGSVLMDAPENYGVSVDAPAEMTRDITFSNVLSQGKHDLWLVSFVHSFGYILMVLNVVGMPALALAAAFGTRYFAVVSPSKFRDKGSFWYCYGYGRHLFRYNYCILVTALPFATTGIVALATYGASAAMEPMASYLISSLCPFRDDKDSTSCLHISGMPGPGAWCMLLQGLGTTVFGYWTLLEYEDAYVKSLYY